MKIEKLNEHQIRCELTRDELTSRDIKLSELAYGNAKARGLFSEMMKQAYQEYGFECQGEPVMIEATPVSSGSLMLTITKVDSPEELDTRFARFSRYEKALTAQQKSVDSAGSGTTRSASDIIEMYHKAAEEAKKAAVEKKSKDALNLERVYQFHSMEELYRLSSILNLPENFKSSLYKDIPSSRYFLKIEQNQIEPEPFNQVNNQISEYGTAVPKIRMNPGYLKEHCKVLLPQNALEQLASLA